MKYRESKLDKELRQWFAKDLSKALLHSVSLKGGTLRSLTAFDVKFTYPISAFAGINGAGKSTVLAIACCAYHNNPKGFKLRRRTRPYYTFSDFFVQHTNEVSPQGITIRYLFAHDNWTKSKTLPDGKGLAHQSRTKKKGGKWNAYESRIQKAVAFLGIDRIVPHSERSQSRSYSKSFADVKPKGWEGKVKDAVGFVLGRTYDDFRYLEYSKYSLPLVKVGPITYSGFNMGAGESALFEIFSTLYSCNENALLVIDEIELGLHAKAQKLFINKLKEVCKETGTQVICTTHSKEIFDCLPEDARFYIEKVGAQTRITQGISSEFAFSKMGGPAGNELEVFVEDEVAEAILLAFLPASQRVRIRITVVGSATAIARQLAAAYVRGDGPPVLAVLDGDQREKEKDNLAHAKNMAEDKTGEVAGWAKARTAYLPGETWPEAWLLQKCLSASSATADSLLVEEASIPALVEYGHQAGKHNEFFEIGKNVGLGKDECLRAIVRVICNQFPEEFEPLRAVITMRLDTGE
jgi:predicted ATPase